LRELSDVDIKATYDYYSSKSNFEFVHQNEHKTIQETKEYMIKMKKGVAEDKWIIWAIALKETNQIIGTISIWNFDDKKTKGEFGYGIYPKYRKSGYMSEALQATLTYAFNTLQMRKVEAYTSHDNLPSVNFLKKMNFDFIETIEDEYLGGLLMDVFEMRNK
jgi:ribosomal-protein-alanine N-acetyltransferase